MILKIYSDFISFQWNNVPQDQILKQKLKCSFSTTKSSGVETGASESHMDFLDETPNPPSSNLTTNDIPDMDMEQTSSDTKEVATEEDLVNFLLFVACF